MTTVLEAVRSHHKHYSTHYGDLDFSDHGPMAALALQGLGADAATTLNTLERYRAHLRPIDRASTDYRRWLAEYLDRMTREGAAEVLRAELPRYLSGWARDAYHPLIRLAYGWEFDVLEEMAAGLAYLRTCGADPALEDRAQRMRMAETTAADLFRSMSPVAVADARSFDAGLKRVVENRTFEATLTPDTLERMTRTALDVFASTHDFFALHLVTGSYAYRMLYAFAGPNADALFTLGLLAGYAAIGAPAFNTVASQKSLSENVTEFDWLKLVGDDEHDIKIAWSARRLAEMLKDDAFTAVARTYLLDRT